MGAISSYFNLNSGSQEKYQTSNSPKIDRTPDEKTKREKMLKAIQGRIPSYKFGIRNAEKVHQVTTKQNRKYRRNEKTYGNYKVENDLQGKMQPSSLSKTNDHFSYFNTGSQQEHQSTNDSYVLVDPTPDEETKREKMLQATEKRIQKDKSGIPNPKKIGKLMEKQNRKYHMEEQAYKNYKGESNLKWKV